MLSFSDAQVSICSRILPTGISATRTRIERIDERFELSPDFLDLLHQSLLLGMMRTTSLPADAIEKLSHFINLRLEMCTIIRGGLHFRGRTGFGKLELDLEKVVLLLERCFSLLSCGLILEHLGPFL